MVSEIVSTRFIAAEVEQALQLPDDCSDGRLWDDFSQAVLNGDLAQVRKLQEDGADLRHQDDAGVSALMLAAKQVQHPWHQTSPPTVLYFHTTRPYSKPKRNEQSKPCHQHECDLP